MDVKVTNDISEKNVLSNQLYFEIDMGIIFLWYTGLFFLSLLNYENKIKL